MAKYVVDASVGIKWFLPEPQEEKAELLFADGHTLFVPDLFYAEVANILWKRVHFGDMHPSIAANALAALDSFVLETSACASLMSLALEIAIHAGCTVYYALYVALAVESDAVLITADVRLCNLLSQDSLKKYILLLEDLKP